MLTSVLCVCVVTNILHEGLHIVSFYLGCCTSNYNLPATLPPGEGILPLLMQPLWSPHTTKGSCYILQQLPWFYTSSSQRGADVLA